MLFQQFDHKDVENSEESFTFFNDKKFFQTVFDIKSQVIYGNICSRRELTAMLLNIGNEKRINDIPIVQIRPCRVQSRKIFSQQELKELAQSVKQNGILQPLTVRKINTIEYELISGERRLRAAAMCGNKKVPCIIINCTDKQADVYSLIENIQRCDLNFFEEAEGIERLMNLYGLSRLEVSRKLGKKQSTISNKLRILKLTAEEKEILLKYRLTERHARALLRVEDVVLRRIILSEIISQGLNVSQSERYIDMMLAEKNRERQKTQKTRLVIKDIKIFENDGNSMCGERK